MSEIEKIETELGGAIACLRSFCANACYSRSSTLGASRVTCGEELSCKIGIIIVQLGEARDMRLRMARKRQSEE